VAISNGVEPIFPSTTRSIAYGVVFKACTQRSELQGTIYGWWLSNIEQITNKLVEQIKQEGTSAKEMAKLCNAFDKYALTTSRFLLGYIERSPRGRTVRELILEHQRSPTVVAKEAHRSLIRQSLSALGQRVEEGATDETLVEKLETVVNSALT